MKPVVGTIVCWLSALVALADDTHKPMPAKESELQRELLRRKKTDQVARNAMISWMNDHGSNGVVVASTLSTAKKTELERLTSKVTAIDEDNTKWLKGIVETHGWPTNSLVGKDGADAAWLLVQHADHDLMFQRRCLDLIAKLPKDEVSQSHMAYLTDRVLLAEGKKQRYGTQFSDVGGKLKPRPLEDEANVDKRRAQVGLPPLAEYVKLIEQQYSGLPKK